MVSITFAGLFSFQKKVYDSTRTSSLYISFLVLNIPISSSSSSAALRLESPPPQLFSLTILKIPGHFEENGTKTKQFYVLSCHRVLFPHGTQAKRLSIPLSSRETKPYFLAIFFCIVLADHFQDAKE